jgi:hypothetical protein
MHFSVPCYILDCFLELAITTEYVVDIGKSKEFNHAAKIRSRFYVANKGGIFSTKKFDLAFFPSCI